jgi:SH3-like domain-containing protein
LFAVLFVRMRAREGSRALLTAVAVIVAFVTLSSGALLGGRIYLDRVPFGIVLPDAVQVKEGADNNYRTAFELHAGLKIRLVERDQDWLRVRLPNGLEGWVRDQDVGRL